MNGFTIQEEKGIFMGNQHNDADVGKRIVALMEKADGMTQRELGEKIGRGQSQLSSWLSGKTSIPVKALNDIAKVFDTTMDYLYNGDDGENTDALPGDSVYTFIGGLCCLSLADYVENMKIEIHKHDYFFYSVGIRFDIHALWEYTTINDSMYNAPIYRYQPLGVTHLTDSLKSLTLSPPPTKSQLQYYDWIMKKIPQKLRLLDNTEDITDDDLIQNGYQDYFPKEY